MDEINYAIHYGFLDAETVIEALKARLPDVHVLLTGRDARPDLIALADTVTEMRAVKHIFESGARATRGIEY
jgi:cob(I)alamin adenosyltransferase